jgi:hypothetical protein
MNVGKLVDSEIVFYFMFELQSNYPAVNNV